VSEKSAQLTQLIHQWQNGSLQDFSRLYELVYDELKVIAGKELKRFWNMQTISTTSLVNEAYLKLVSQKSIELSDRSHFFAVSATAMRHILVNYLDAKRSQKRGGDWVKLTVSILDNHLAEAQKEDHILAVNQAVETLKELDEPLSKLVEMRFFAGMTEAEIAEVCNCSERTVRRNWQTAKALLQRILEEA